ncbi:hypothetical protein MNBD_PLANCTO03-716 [hydrothermal vent metagenome]|uniref:DNA methylase adenine-specific domain-containing protein n=1 Tax=hydrothermal vent metagenome TaxID=652676 RepID=A0A3B1DK37_9ZZZZ
MGWLCEQPIPWHSIDAHWLGRAYQHALDEAAVEYKNSTPKSRRTRGVFYTPLALVTHLLDQTLDRTFLDHRTAPVILDPACGCGVFLVEALRRLRSLRPDIPRAALLQAIHGIDIDPLATHLCRLALWLELSNAPESHDSAHTLEPLFDLLEANIVTADTLLDPPGMETVDLLLGNPPFLNQVASSTARSRADTARLRERFGDSLRPYTDPAALFLQLGIESLRPGGRLGMVLPVSLLAARDAVAVRERVAEITSICSLWLDTEGIFDASVRTVAVTFERKTQTSPLRRFVGSGMAPKPEHAAAPLDSTSWGPLAAPLVGVPEMHFRTTQTLGDHCEITADFRDEYYAIARAISEAENSNTQPTRRVATVGLIDPACLAWGERPVKIARQTWHHPCVTHHADDPVLREVLIRQARPKLLIATQSKVLEAAVDHRGEYLALTPIIMLYPKEDPPETNADALWRYGALLSSPVLSAWAAARSFGTARSLHAIKPSAALLREAPLPLDHTAWRASATHYRAACTSHSAKDRNAALLLAAKDSCTAYQVEPAAATRLIAWWQSRLPTPRPQSAPAPK